MKITVFTIAFNGYGEFIPRWLKSVESQIYPAHEIIIVLGYRHGLQNNFNISGVKAINYGLPTTMGFLRNLAVDMATGDYIFYFSADDILFGNALQEISNVKADLIALRYYQENRLRVTPEITVEQLKKWTKHNIGACGYVAFKKGLRYEDTDWPNYPLLFQAYTKRYTFKPTEAPGAIYLQRRDGHGLLTKNNVKGESVVRKYLSLYGLTT